MNNFGLTFTKSQATNFKDSFRCVKQRFILMPMRLQTLTIWTQFNFTVGNVPTTFYLNVETKRRHSIVTWYRGSMKRERERTNERTIETYFLLSTIKVILTMAKVSLNISICTRDPTIAGDRTWLGRWEWSIKRCQNRHKIWTKL